MFSFALIALRLNHSFSPDESPNIGWGYYVDDVATNHESMDDCRKDTNGTIYYSAYKQASTSGRCSEHEACIADVRSSGGIIDSLERCTGEYSGLDTYYSSEWEHCEGYGDSDGQTYPCALCEAYAGTAPCYQTSNSYAQCSGGANCIRDTCPVASVAMIATATTNCGIPGTVCFAQVTPIPQGVTANAGCSVNGTPLGSSFGYWYCDNTSDEDSN